LASGTVRGRVGYAPGSWLFYATGGFAWTYDQQSLTQLATGASESPFLWRLGYAAGAGVETPVARHWTARLEYLFTGYGNSSRSFPCRSARCALAHLWCVVPARVRRRGRFRH
jgi:high affinity Mn2+ porin